MEGEGLKGDEAREREVILFILSFFLSPQFLFPVFLSCPRNLSYLVSFIAFVFYLFSLSFFLPFPFSALRPFSLPTFLSFSPIFSLSFSLFPTLPPFSPLFWKCFSFLLRCRTIFRSLPPPFLNFFLFFHRLSIPVLPPVFPPLSFLWYLLFLSSFFLHLITSVFIPVSLSQHFYICFIFLSVLCLLFPSTTTSVRAFH